MGICCDLEVDVNGEEIFLVDKKLLASFSGRLSKLFGKLVHTRSHLKVIFHDFPGGAEAFELIVRFCYNGEIEITPSNTFLLHFAANFMEMKENSYGIPNLIGQTEKYLEGCQSWTWSDLLQGLKQCQGLFAVTNSSSICEKFLDLFVGRLSLLSFASFYASSSDTSTYSSSKISCDTSSDSVKSYLSQAPWWCEHLVFLNINLFEKILKVMISQKFDHSTLSAFLFNYQRRKFFGSPQAKKREIIEAVTNLLFSLDSSSIPPKGLFHLFRLALCLKISKSCKNKLEALVGSKLDQATIDNLLVPSPRGKKYLYDVNLIMRLLKSFLAENQFSPYRLKKVARLMDLYLAEVAPDPNLKPSKFVALATLLPDFVKDYQDRMYLAIDTYLKVHGSLCQEERMKVCSVLNSNKLSMEALIDMVKNYKLPPGTVLRARTSQKYKLKSLTKDSKNVNGKHNIFMRKT